MKIYDKEKLHVVTTVFNPMRYKTRYKLFKDFEKHMADSGANLYVVEVAFGDRPFEVTEAFNPKHLQLRTSSHLWHKEQSLNLIIQKLPADWRYVCWCDSDITFTRADWVNETLHALQHWPIVQNFETVINLGPTGAFLNTFNGFAAMLQKKPENFDVNGDYYGENSNPFPHPGFVWSARREAFEALGGLPGFPILGAADHHLALALAGQVHKSLPGGLHSNYDDMVMEIQERAKVAHLINNIGPVPGSIFHHFHGSFKKRRYKERWSILQNHQFNPMKDIKIDSQGLYQLSVSGYRMNQDLITYFKTRDEDDPCVD